MLRRAGRSPRSDSAVQIGHSSPAGVLCPKYRLGEWRGYTIRRHETLFPIQDPKPVPAEYRLVSSTLRAAVLRLLVRVLEPLIRLLLDVGVGAGEMTRLVRSVYVKVAAERVSRGQARPNISRIAVVTGLARPEIRALLAAAPETPAQYSWDRHRAERVLHAWCNDPTYFDAQGKPADLPRKGPRKSFAALVKMHSATPLAGTILEELERAKAVKILPDGKVRLLSRSLANAQYKEETVEIVGERARDLLTTLAHNLGDPNHPRFE